tara:strand:- start:1900 stop:2040 length:141 start_codon:yes stop_codon:yes gene_type:complete
MPVSGQSTLSTKYSMRLTNKHQNIEFLPIRARHGAKPDSAMKKAKS